MSDAKSIVIKLYPMRTWQRELWSDFCTFSVIVGLFGIGWWFDSGAMQWFAFVACFLILLANVNSSYKKFSPQEAVDFLTSEYGAATSPAQTDASDDTNPADPPSD